MNKKEFLGTSLHAGLKFTSVMDDVKGMPPSNRIWTYNGLMQLFGDLCLNTIESSDAYPVQSIKIIVRPLSDLTKPITHNGETFVPIVEIARLCFNYMQNPKKVIIRDNWLLYGETRLMQLKIDFLPFMVIQKLIEWHFNLMDESEPFIPVTEEFNPYK